MSNDVSVRRIRAQAEAWLAGGAPPPESAALCRQRGTYAAAPGR